MNRKPSRLVIFLATFGVAFFLTLSVVLFVVLPLLGVFAFVGWFPYGDSEEGLYRWQTSRAEEGTVSIWPDSKREFFTAYPYEDGNYHDAEYSSWFEKNRTARTFVWLTYSDPDVYAGAKTSHMETHIADPDLFKRIEAYGFTFYVYDTFKEYEHKRIGKPSFTGNYVSLFPEQFSAFGYNDEAGTLVFLRFWGYGKKESPYIERGNTDFGAFLDHYFGEWFDWERGVGIHLSE